MWWECSECGGLLERVCAPEVCDECGTASGLFAEAATLEAFDDDDRRAAWMRIGFERAARAGDARA
jgi:rubrerythrin